MIKQSAAFVVTIAAVVCKKKEEKQRARERSVGYAASACAALGGGVEQL
jgi:hypothetical protein